MVGRTSTNDMGGALDLHFNKNGSRIKLPSDMDKIRKDIFCMYMGAAGKDRSQLEHKPNEFIATSWIHLDVREFESKYKNNTFFIKDQSNLTPQKMVDIAKVL